MNRRHRVEATCIAAMIAAGLSGPAVHRGLAQTPTTPVSRVPLVSLSPLVLVNVAVDGVAKGITSINDTRLPTPQIDLPRAGGKTLEFSASNAQGPLTFFDTVPSGVPVSAFVWQSTTAPAGDVQSSTVPAGTPGKLRFNGCGSCPTSFTLGIRVNDTVRSASGQVTINLTASTGRPAILGISHTGGSPVEPEFTIRFASGTFDPADSQVMAIYPNNLKYRLIPERSSSLSQSSLVAVVPRLGVERAVQVALSNPYGAASTTIELPAQPDETFPPFECVNCSDVLPPGAVHDTFSVKHISGVLDINGSDDITISPLLSGASACDQKDFIFTGAAVAWINPDNGSRSSSDGTAVIASHPPVNVPLRAPQNVVRSSWMLRGLKGERWLQVAFRGVDIVGTCSNRVLQ